MLASVMLIASLALLLFWFRYSCGLILSAKSARDYTRTVAAANELQFLEVQRDLVQARDCRHLDALARKLEQDYHLLSFLLRHSPALYTGSDRLEQRMLMCHFQLMRSYYAVICHMSRFKAQQAVQEMARVVSYFANRMGERAACSAAAV